MTKQQTYISAALLTLLASAWLGFVLQYLPPPPPVVHVPPSAEALAEFAAFDAIEYPSNAVGDLTEAESEQAAFSDNSGSVGGTGNDIATEVSFSEEPMDTATYLKYSAQLPDLFKRDPQSSITFATRTPEYQ